MFPEVKCTRPFLLYYDILGYTTTLCYTVLTGGQSCDQVIRWCETYSIMVELNNSELLKTEIILRTLFQKEDFCNFINFWIFHEIFEIQKIYENSITLLSSIGPDIYTSQNNKKNIEIATFLKRGSNLRKMKWKPFIETWYFIFICDCW